MQELYNQIQSATDPLEIIYLCDKFLDKQLTGYIKLMFLKGETLLSLGRFDDALSIFEQILEYDDNNFAGRAHNSIGFCYSIKNEFEKAEFEFEKAREYCDESSLSLNFATLNLATLYPMTNKKESTFKIFKELYDLNPSNEKEDVHISFLKLASNPEELIMLYNSSIDESYNADVNVLFAKGDALVNLQKFDDAINVFEEIPKYPYDKEVVGKAHNAMGFCYSRKNELDKAICEFENAYEYSKDPTILYNLASHYTMANQKEKSLEIFKELSALDPYNKDVKKIIELLELELNRKNLNNKNSFNSVQEALKQADTYWEEKEYEKVIEVYDSISDFMPKQPLVWNRKGDANYHLGRYEEAIKCFDKAFKYNPHSPFPLYYKSLSYMNLEDYDNAEDMIVQALMFFPDNPGFLNNYCVILNKLGKYEEAIDTADKALIINPDSFETYTNKAHALEKLNRFDEALECYDKSLKINPNFFEAWYNKTYALEKLGRIDEAIECYDKALKINPNIIDAWLNKANTLKDYERFDEALKCYKKALTHFPHNPDILYYMSTLYLIKGDMDNSFKCLNESHKYSDL